MTRRRVLIVVAHPDDETIFFGGTAADAVDAGARVDIVCATGRFGSASWTARRRSEFRRACAVLGARGVMLDLPDCPGGLPQGRLETQLAVALGRTGFDAVYTHGAWGEYGHPHHRCVCLAVHRLFGRGVLSLAGPLTAPPCEPLAGRTLALKRRLAAAVYRSQPFAASWCSIEEPFITLAPQAVELFAPSDGPASARPARLSNSIGRIATHALRRFERATPFAEIATIPRHVWLPAFTASARRLRALLGDQLPR
jgi:hypothetical protein